MIVRPLSTVDNTRDYARVSLSRQWSNYNLSRLVVLAVFVEMLQVQLHFTSTSTILASTNTLIRF